MRLAHGFHFVLVDYFENLGHAILKVSYSGPDTDGEATPIQAWSVPAAAQCWMRLPSGCAQALGETDTPTNWFVDPPGTASEAECSSRKAAYNSNCQTSGMLVLVGLFRST